MSYLASAMTIVCNISLPAEAVVQVKWLPAKSVHISLISAEIHHLHNRCLRGVGTLFLAIFGSPVRKYREVGVTVLKF